MKITDNEFIKKATPQERQDIIVENLTDLMQGKIPNNKIKTLAEVILKLYLLDKGESIDVDFSDRISKLFAMNIKSDTADRPLLVTKD